MAADQRFVNGIRLGARGTEAEGQLFQTNAAGDLVEPIVGTVDGQVPVWDNTLQRWVPGAGGGGTSVEVADEDTTIHAAATRINFTGAGVTATDDGAGGVDVDIPGGGGGGITGARATITFSSPSIAAGDWEVFGQAIAKGIRILRFQADYSCRIVVCRTETAANVDAASGRATSVKPDPGDGVFADTSLSSGNGKSQWQSPPPEAFSEDASTTLWFAVRSYMTAATAFSITVTYVVTEV
jgi:hypothetical protein